MSAGTTAVAIAGSITTLAAGLGAAHISSKRAVEGIRATAEEARADRTADRQRALHEDILDWALRCYVWAGYVGAGFAYPYPGEETEDAGRSLMVRVTLYESPAVHSAFMRFHAAVLNARALIPPEGGTPLVAADVGTVDVDVGTPVGRAVMECVRRYPALIEALRSDMGLDALQPVDTDVFTELPPTSA